MAINPFGLPGLIAQGIKKNGVGNTLSSGFSSSRNILGAQNPTYSDNSQAVLGASTTNYGPTQLAPNTTDPNSFRNSGTYTGGGAGSAASAQAAADAQERAATLYGIDQGITGAERGISDIAGQRQTGLGNIDRDYQHEYDILTGNRRQANSQLDQKQTSQLNEYGSKRNQNNEQAANYLQGGLRTLGANGAGGGSAARYGLPFDAQTMATRLNSGAQATNTANMAAIAGSRQQNETQFGNAENDLSRQREQGIRDFTGGLDQTEAGLYGQLQGLRGQRAIANGGDINAAQREAAPYTSRINELLASVARNAATPQFKAQQVNTAAPDLSQYAWNRPEVAPTPQQDPGLQGNNVNPILSLFGLNPDDQQQQYV